MTDRDRTPRDIWKEPPSGSEGDAVKDFEPVADQAPAEGSTEQEAEERGYEPKHRAPGRAPLIRRRRSKAGDEETVSWETSWSEPSDHGEQTKSRWRDEEEPSITPPPRPIEEVPYLGPRRSEQRKRRARPPAEESEAGPSTRSREYTGRHLAPKKPRWSRDAEDEAPRPAEETEADATFVEGDVDDAPEREPAAAEQAEVRDGTPVDAEAEVEAERAAPVSKEPEAPAAEVSPEASEDHEDTAPPPAEVAAAAAGPRPAASQDTPASSQPAPETGGNLFADEAFDRTPPEAPGPSQSPAAPSAAGLHTTPEAADDAPENASDIGDEDPEGSGELVLDEDEDESPAGPRRAALEQRKKKKRLLQTGVGALALLVAVVGAVGAGFLVKEAVDDPEQRTAVPFQPPEEEELGGTTLIFGTKEKADPSRGAIWIVLLTVDPETEEASIVYVPSHTAVEVPGRGLQGVGESYGSGGVPLLLVSAENLLGIGIDHYVELSDKDAQVLFEQFETLTVDVPAEVRVPAGRDQARLIFVEGPQEMTPSSLVRLLYTMGIDGDDVELGSRHLAFWDQLLEVYDDPAELAAAFEAAGAALGESDASAKELAAFVELVAAVPSEDVTLTALPVRPISAGDAQLYSVDAEELAAFVDETIGTRDETEQDIRVQLLNGNGVPGIGREAAAKLVGEGFRVILGGNARRLDYRKTLVIAYDSSDRGVALAERARELLGVGEVQVSAQQQGIVDLTIVVGKDFLRAR